MSKFVKDLLAKDLASRLDGVENCLVADVIGMDANATTALRKRLREKEIHLMVIKNSSGSAGHGRKSTGASV
jgi:large subunit ribosomal protein L10